MFEKANPIAASLRHSAGSFRSEDSRSAARHAPAPGTGERFETRGPRRAGDALRAVEWSEITARLNAARDLRLLMRNDSQTQIEAAAASFGDAAASYFALIDEDEPDVNRNALGQSKAFGVIPGPSEANRPGDAADQNAGAAPDDAREVQ